MSHFSQITCKFRMSGYPRFKMWAIMELRMSQLYDYECRSYMSTRCRRRLRMSQLYDYECRAETTKVRAKSSNFPIFLGYHVFFRIFRVPASFSIVPLFPEIVIFRISGPPRYPRNFRRYRFSRMTCALLIVHCTMCI